MDKILKKLTQFNYTLPEPKAAIASYVPVQKTKTGIYVSGQLPMKNEQLLFKGKVGAEIDLETAQQAAELCALNILAQLYHYKYPLEQLKLIKLMAFVNHAENFSNIHLVANGASNFFLNILGQQGEHVRSAIGVYGLPLGACVEIEAIFEQAE